MGQPYIYTQDRLPVNLCVDPNQRLRVSQPVDIFGCKQAFDELVLAIKNRSTSGNTFFGAITWLEPN